MGRSSGGNEENEGGMNGGKKRRKRGEKEKDKLLDVARTASILVSAEEKMQGERMRKMSLSKKEWEKEVCQKKNEKIMFVKDSVCWGKGNVKIQSQLKIAKTIK